jgi:hypothetical protein
MLAATATTADITTAAATEAFDSPGVLAESVEMLRTIMRTSDKESARLSAARTLANLAARFITRRPPQPSRDTDHPGTSHVPITPTITAADIASPTPPASPASHASPCAPPPITDSPTSAPGDASINTPGNAPRGTPSPQPPGDPLSARPRRAAARSRRTNTAPPPITTTSATSSVTPTPTPPRRFVTAIPPLIDKHYPAPNAVLDPLFDILASPIPTDPMTEAELDDLQAIHVNLKREDLRNPRRAARWRHLLREDRFWKAYWQEWRKNPDEFKRCYEAFMNRKPAATSASASTSTSTSPSEPLASASSPTPQTSGP